MTTTSRRILLGVLILLGGFVGVWAAVFPGTFYSSFPGFGLGPWVGEDGAYNEHLIRDVGELNLALAAAAVAALLMRNAVARLAASRIVAIAWLVYSIPHLSYHLAHLDGLGSFDAVAEPIALSIGVVLSIPLLIGDRATNGIRTGGESPA